MLTGHVWDADNTPGVLVSLGLLRYGDRILVHAHNQVYAYEVRSVRGVAVSGLSAVFQHEERSWLALFTCLGYNEHTGAYRGRMMARAVLMEVR